MQTEDIRSYLDDDETVLWKGQPRQGLRLRPADWVMVPFSAVWVLLVLAWAIVSFSNFDRSGPTIVMWSVGILASMFLLIGLYLLIGRFWTDWAVRRATLYVLTDRRAVIIAGVFQFAREARSVALSPQLEVHITEYPDRSGSIFFGESPLLSNAVATADALSPAFPRPFIFDHIDDVRDVFRLVENHPRLKQG